MSILLVDDQPGVRLMLETMLRDAGYNDVVSVESAQQVFDHLHMSDGAAPTLDVDLILMDISMPEIDGVEACRRIKCTEAFKDIQVIMVTGLADNQDLEAAFAAGAVDYICKPPNMAEMLARVRSALDLKREMDRRRASHASVLQVKNRELELAFAELEQKNRELEEASLAKTQILATATHELKTPLTSIVGYVDRLLLRQDTVGELNEKQTRYLTTVQKNSRRLKSLVDDLLDVSLIEAGGLELTLLDLNVRQEIEESIQNMQSQVSDKNINLQLNIPPDLGLVKGDRLRFSQVMTNLLSNACKYSPVEATVTISASDNQKEVQIDVADTGIGISQADQAQLFNKFFRADNTSTREESGTGLGLYITKLLVEAHYGRIWTDSAINQGTTFHFTWQRADGNTPSQINAQQDQPVEHA
ncbi:MAG: hybrid sensor histidine kinase/response regulator [Chloroflexi bacterium]|nr:hybrid sensor histidine kinase/response regulator [Chloroflexota bacterium]